MLILKSPTRVGVSVLHNLSAGFREELRALLSGDWDTQQVRIDSVHDMIGEG